MSSLFSIRRFIPRQNPKSVTAANAAEMPAATRGEGALIVPVVEESDTDRQRQYWQAVGQKLARQEEWAALEAKIEGAPSG